MGTNRVSVKQATVSLSDVASDLAKLLGAKVGYLAETTGPQTYDNGLTLAKNAEIHEYGTEIDHPGGTPYFMRGGKSVFVSNKGHGAYHTLPTTKAHRISIPPRPFMRTGAEAFDKMDRQIGNVLRDVIDGKMQPKQGSNRLGVMLQTEIKRAIRSGDFTPLKPATIKRKGSSTPLIDTGKLRQGVDVRTK